MLGLPTNKEDVDTSLMYLLGMVDTLFSGPPMTTNALVHEDFFDGIAAEALIYYYDNWDADPRIRPALEKVCRGVYRYLWDAKHHMMIYSPFPKNPGPVHSCVDLCQEEETTLMNLVIPAFWWTWRKTSNDDYRRMGDELFAHSLDEAINDKGKSYSQNYHWSITGVLWRTLPN